MVSRPLKLEGLAEALHLGGYEEQCVLKELSTLALSLVGFGQLLQLCARFTVKVS
jgi:hypothetical protein